MPSFVPVVVTSWGLLLRLELTALLVVTRMLVGAFVPNVVSTLANNQSNHPLVVVVL